MNLNKHKKYQFKHTSQAQNKIFLQKCFRNE